MAETRAMHHKQHNQVLVALKNHAAPTYEMANVNLEKDAASLTMMVVGLMVGANKLLAEVTLFATQKNHAPII